MFKEGYLCPDSHGFKAPSVVERSTTRARSQLGLNPSSAKDGSVTACPASYSQLPPL